MLKWIIPIVFLGICVISQTECCNEAVCGSVVSKCLLTQSCKCDLKNCTCCKDCANCLSYLYSECCSCVDICPKANETESTLSKKSHVEDFPDGGVPGLFNSLTEHPDDLQRWNSITYPIDLDPNHFGPKKEIKIYFQSAEQEVVQKHPSTWTVNCTVSFWGQCMSWAKCKSNCHTMGSSSYRWFHDGCCECIGENCINYGINESRCKQCSLNEEFEEEIEEEQLNFGEDEGIEEND